MGSSRFARHPLAVLFMFFLVFVVAAGALLLSGDTWAWSRMAWMH